jgi:cell division septation protein DedD
VKPQLASLTVKVPPARPLLHQGKSNTVVQLGAYSSREGVEAAWTKLTKRYPKLRAYAPMTARFDSPKGTVYRLAIKGFSSQHEAVARCSQLKSSGGACFVRNVAGDSPVQFASR